MVRRQIDLDDETDRILAEPARDYDGAHRVSLRAQVERSEQDFREGRFTTWEEVRRGNKL